MSEFEFPTNIKQIGSIGDGVRIYIEDYAYTYLQQYAETGGYEERIALLVGRHLIIDGNKVLFISGAIQGMYTIQEKGITTFTEQSMSYAYEQMQTYFRDLEIVGWMQSQPSYGVLLNSNYANYHANTFIKPDQVLFIMDPIENLNAFYVWNLEKEDLDETRGYFIYYDKNHGMQEYMLANRVKIKPKSSFSLLSKAAEYAIPEEDEPEADLDAETEDEDADSMSVRFVKPRLTAERAPQPGERRVVNLLVSLSAVLVLVCFIMGAGLIQNEGRISNLEDQLVMLTTSYRDLIVQVRENNTESVFAAQPSASLDIPDLQDEPTLTLVSPTPTPEPTPEPEPEPALTSTPTPAPEPTVSAASSIPETYTVEIGDSLIYISRKFYGTSDMVAQIMELNGIDKPDQLYYGTVIKLPR